VAVALVALLLGCLGAGVSEVRAQLANTFSTTTAVVPGGTLTLAVTTSGVLITGTSITTCSATTPPPAATVTYTCSGGLNSGTLISQTFSVPSGPISETVTYNANGPSTAFAAVATSVTDPGTCFGGSPFNCTGTTSVTTIPGGQLQIKVQTTCILCIVQITSAPNPIGTCSTTSVVSAPSLAGGFTTLTYTCLAGQSVPAGTIVSGINGQQTPLAPPPTVPTLTIIDNANAPVPASLAIPTPTSQTVTIGAVAAPTLATISPANGPAGTSVTLTGTNLSGATAINFGTTPGTSVSCSTGTSCTVTAPTLAPNTVANVTVVTPGGTSNALSFTFVAATPGVPANVAFVSPPTSGSVGQSVTFTAATATTTASCGSITSYKIDFGDGSPVQTSATPSATTHTYSSPGTFTVTLTVTDCAGGIASTSTTIAISAPTGPAVAFAAGWNLVSGPSGSVFSQCNGPLYTFQAGNTAYQVVPNTSGIVSGQGYWCFLNAPTTLSLNGQGTTSASISAPPSQWVMVGNPSATQTLTVHGADSVVTWNPGTGAYVPASVLVPGQGAWAISLDGGTITVSP